MNKRLIIITSFGLSLVILTIFLSLHKINSTSYIKIFEKDNSYLYYLKDSEIDDSLNFEYIYSNEESRFYFEHAISHYYFVQCSNRVLTLEQALEHNCFTITDLLELDLLLPVIEHRKDDVETIIYGEYKTKMEVITDNNDEKYYRIEGTVKQIDKSSDTLIVWLATSSTHEFYDIQVWFSFNEVDDRHFDIEVDDQITIEGIIKEIKDNQLFVVVHPDLISVLQ